MGSGVSLTFFNMAFMLFIWATTVSDTIHRATLPMILYSKDSEHFLQYLDCLALFHLMYFCLILFCCWPCHFFCCRTEDDAR